MPLSNQQYNLLMQDFDSRRLYDRRKLEERRREAYLAIPELQAIDERLAHDSVHAARISLQDGSDCLTELKAHNLELIERKKRLLVQNGFPPDFLELQYFCKLCYDTGFTSENQKCQCLKQAMVKMLFAESPIHEIVKKENFEAFSLDLYPNSELDPVIGKTPYENMKCVLADVHEFIGNFHVSYRNLLIYGSTGVGKTFLTHCIAAELMSRSFSIIYLTATELFDTLAKYRFGRDESGDVADSYLASVIEGDLLIIDDLGTELSNSFTLSQLYLCIDGRQRRQKSTVISTNLSFGQLEEYYGERIFSRIAGGYTLLKIIGNDLRIK